MHGTHGIHRTGDGLQARLQFGIAAGVELGHPGIGERLAGVRFNASGFAAHGFADEDLHAVLRADGPARFVEHGAQHAVGDGFAVYQHAIAVEQYCFKFHSW